MVADSRQMSFDFFDEIPNPEEKKVEQPLFESESDAVETLLGRKSDNPTVSPASAEDTVFSAPEAEQNPVETVIPTQEAGELSDPFADDEPAAQEVIAEEPAVKQSKKAVLTKALLSRAALAFLCSRKPASAAGNLMLHSIHKRIAAASFNVETFRTDSVKVFSTAICEISMAPDDLFADPDVQKKIRGELNGKLEEKNVLEARLREMEPDLNDSIFSDMPDWHYERTKNRSYHSCLRAIGKLQFELDHCGKLAQFSAKQFADEYFLAAPKGKIDPTRLPAEWGLVEVDDDLNFILVKESVVCKENGSDEVRNDLALRIAAAAKENVEFANGISSKHTGEVTLTALPRKRRKGIL